MVLIPLPFLIYFLFLLDASFVHQHDLDREEYVRKLHAQVREKIEKKMEHYAIVANKRRNEVVYFSLGIEVGFT